MNYSTGVNAELGNELTPIQVKNQPFVSWDNDPNSFYTLSFIGKDKKNKYVLIISILLFIIVISLFVTKIAMYRVVVNLQ